MALVTTFICSRCREPRYEVVTSDRVCSHCRAEDASVASAVRRTTLRGLTALTPEERLARIEEAVYDLAALERRVGALEVHNVTY